MKHLFVPYELAKLAKEKGFNEPCLTSYSKGELNHVFEYANSEKPDDNFISNDEVEHDVTAPLYQQLVDWFREKHDLWIAVEKTQVFGLYIPTINNEPQISEANFTGYYEALTAALTKAFELI